MKPGTIKVLMIVWMLLLIISCRKSNKAPQEFRETQSPLLVANTIKVNDQIHGFYSAVPAHYQETSQTYPLLIWIHGNGQVGNGSTEELPRILYGGVPKLLDEKLFPPYFTVNGRNYSFIVLAPQFTGWPGNDQVQSFVNYAKEHYRVDQSRIYLGGLSMGGTITTDFSADYASELAAIVPVAGVSITGDISAKCSEIAAAQLPVWIFQNSGDDVFNPDNARSFVSLMNGFKPIMPVKYTELLPYGENGHDAWTTATDPNYREANMNIYEWMLQYKK